MKPINTILLVYFLILALLIGCNPVEKAKKTLSANKEEAAKFCADEFPVKEVFIKGDSVVITDTLESFEVWIDTVTTKDTVYITKTLPGKVITRTVRTTDTVVRRDMARESVLEDQLINERDLTQELIKQNTELQKKVNRWKGKIGIPWWVFLVLLTGLFLGFKGKILSLFK